MDYPEEIGSCERGLDQLEPGPRLYIGGSWTRSVLHDAVVAAAKEAGIKHYDYRQPEPGVAGFSWREIETGWADWLVEEYREALEKHPAAKRGFERDMAALEWCDTILVVMPAGFSAGFELGYARHAGKRCIVLLAPGQYDLMIRGCTLVTSVEAAIDAVLA